MRKEIKKKISNMDMSKKDNDVIEKEDEKGGHIGSIWPKSAKNKIL